MKEQFKKALEWAMSRDIKGCVTGSALLKYFDEKSDIDIFCYDQASFLKLYYEMYYDPMFQILDKIELWKAQQIMTKDFFINKHFTGVTSLKFTYNTCINLNIVLKKGYDNVFAVLSSFDINLVCKAYDLSTKKYLDLTEGSTESKIVNYNSWNPAFLSTEIWQISRILRQMERIIKYHKRGYNTDAVVLKYIELIDRLEEYKSIFKSETFNEKLKTLQTNTASLKKICELWLKTHTITDKELELLQLKIKEL